MSDTNSSDMIFVNETKVKSVLSWPLVNEAVEQALKAECYSDSSSGTNMFSSQPARSFTQVSDGRGVLLTMPGYVGNFKLGGVTHSTLACKLVTCFTENEHRSVPLPNIMATIALFDGETGQLKRLVAGTDITAWRTASASIVATKHLYFQRSPPPSISNDKILAIIGCGVQGRIHAIGMASTFDFSEIRLWNRSVAKADTLQNELIQLKKNFINENIKINVASTVEECVRNSDVIVTATFTKDPLIFPHMLKDNVHINAVGAGTVHHSELSVSLYEKVQLYTDSRASAKLELKDLKTELIGTVGEVIDGRKPYPEKGITAFQSLGMALEDATVAEAVCTALNL